MEEENNRRTRKNKIEQLDFTNFLEFKEIREIQFVLIQIRITLGSVILLRGDLSGKRCPTALQRNLFCRVCFGYFSIFSEANAKRETA